MQQRAEYFWLGTRAVYAAYYFISRRAAALSTRFSTTLCTLIYKILLYSELQNCARARRKRHVKIPPAKKKLATCKALARVLPRRSDR